MSGAPGHTSGDDRGIGNSLIVLVSFPLLLGATIFLFSDSAHSERYAVDLSRALPTPPAWSGAEAAAEQVDELLREVPAANIFDRNLEPALRQKLESSPWVEKVSGVRRVFPGGVRVDLRWRSPYAVLRRRSGAFQLVADDGELLPLLVERSPVRPPYIVLRDLEEARPGETPPVGWLAAAVREGVHVIRDLEKRADAEVFDLLYVMEVDVSNFDGRIDPRRSEVVLGARSTAGVAPPEDAPPPIRILWGRSTRHAKALVELPVAKKLSHLESVVRARPGFKGVRIIDARFDAHLLPGPDGDRGR